MSPWSQIEVEAIVQTYFAILEQELRGEKVNKRDANRHLMVLLNGRTLGSVEFKHANISAILLELGYPYVDGYKPRSNYQDLLGEAVVARLVANQTLQFTVEKAVEEPVIKPIVVLDLAHAIVAAPVRELNPQPRKDKPTNKPQIRLGVNYLEREAKNASLGKAGEEFVLEVEHARLWKLGKKHLAERIEHISQTQGDGFGYDVLSFEETGKERLIEVKTTRFGAMTPFFASRNEVKKSAELDNYQIYRVFKFGDNSKLFILPGALAQSCQLEPIQYRASLL